MKTFKSIVILFVFVFAVSNAVAEDRLVPPNEPNALNGFVKNSNAGDVLLLQAGGTYPNIGTITVDKNLTIRSTGDTKTLGKPRIIELPNASGKFQKLTLGVKANVTLVDLFFDGRLKGQNDVYKTNRHIRILEPDITLVVDSCRFVRASARAIGAPKPNAHLTITNSLFIDDISNASNGRALDFREGPHRYLLFQNNTSVGCSDRIIRHYWFGKTRCPAVDTLIVDHNTFINNLGYRNPFTLGPVKNLQFTNNICYNTGQEGTDTTSNRMKEVTYIVDSVVVNSGPNAVTQLMVTEAGDYNTKAIIENNNMYLDPAFDAVFAKYPNISKMPLMNNELDALVPDKNLAFFDEELAFGKAPGPWVQFMDDWFSIIDTLTSQVEIPPVNGVMDTMWLFKQSGFSDPNPWTLLDMTYPTNTKSYTAASGKFPMGDLNWFPERKKAWEAAGSPTTGVKDNASHPVEFSLKQNYPNPFNPTTSIAYSLAKPGHVKISVYNIVGQKILDLVNGKVAAGTHKAIWNGTDQSGRALSSGIYFCRMETGSHIAMRKMTLVK